MNLKLLQFTNYYERVIKKYDNIVDYNVYCRKNGNTPIVHDIGNINFIPGDGITSSHIINWDLGWDPDYCVAYDDDLDIISRWFVVKTERTRKGQYKIYLKRDTVADFSDTLLDSRSLVSRGYVSKSNPLVLNSEGFTVNQIKSNEVLIPDHTQMPWLVGYLSSNLESLKVGNTWKDVPIKVEGNIYQYDEYDSIPWYNTYQSVIAAGKPNRFSKTGECWYQYSIQRHGDVYNTYSRTNHTIRLYQMPPTSIIGWDWSAYYTDSTFASTGDNTTGLCVMDLKQGSDLKPNISNWASTVNVEAVNGNGSGIPKGYAKYAAKFQELENQYVGTRFGFDIAAENGKIVRLRSGEGYIYKQIVVKEERNRQYKISGLGTKTEPAVVEVFARLHEWHKQQTTYGDYSTFPIFNSVSAYDQKEKLLINSHTYTIEFQDVQLTDMEAIISGEDLNNAPVLNDAPYKMFCMPLPIYTANVNYSSEAAEIDLNKDFTLAIGNALKTALGSLLYDIQILPYCPLEDATVSVGTERTLLTTNAYSVWLKRQASETVENYAKLFFPKSSTFSRTTEVNLNNFGQDEDLKIQNECNFLRLCSPNYQGTFEFTLPKIGVKQINDTEEGSENVSDTLTLNIDCTYKPFSPHIHVAPDFGLLYGSNYGDARGLICGGDFSIPQTDSAWTNYQLENKNYQLQFERNIESMELKQKYAEASAWVSGITNAISAPIKGAGTGMMMSGGNPYVAAAMAGVYQVSAIADAAFNISETTNVGRDAINNAKDQQQFNVENIQARPYSLTNIGCINYDFKYFPFIEYYTCTVEEKDSIRKYLELNGYALNITGTVRDYWKQGKFISGTLMLSNGIGFGAGNASILQDLSSEYARGIFYSENWNGEEELEYESKAYNLHQLNSIEIWTCTQDDEGNPVPDSLLKEFRGSELLEAFTDPSTPYEFTIGAYVHHYLDEQEQHYYGTYKVICKGDWELDKISFGLLYAGTSNQHIKVESTDGSETTVLPYRTYGGNRLYTLDSEHLLENGYPTTNNIVQFSTFGVSTRARVIPCNLYIH